jgi:pyrimidine-nucleoside phosphorylase
VRARTNGVLASADPLELALVAVGLGAGRTRAEDRIDPGAGVELCQAVGETVERGEPIAFLSGASRSAVEAQLKRAERALRVAKSARSRTLVIERIER